MGEGRWLAERRRHRPQPNGVVTVRNGEAGKITGGAALVVVAAGIAFALLAHEPWVRTWAAGPTAGVGPRHRGELTGGRPRPSARPSRPRRHRWQATLDVSVRRGAER
jgi:hypothetical protein